MKEAECEATCIECGNDIGPHHLCTDCLEALGSSVQHRDNFFAWLQAGVNRKWVSEVVCETHDGVPFREWEARDFEEGLDPCISVVRVWALSQEEDPWATTAP